MCAVSMVMQTWTAPSSPNFIPWTQAVPDPSTALQMLEVLKRLDAIDKKLNALECRFSEPEKDAYLRKLQERADQLGLKNE